MNPDTKKIIDHILNLRAEREKAIREFKEEYQSIAARWDQDTDTIGRILRAHLFVEHLMTENLTSRNPELGSAPAGAILCG